MLDQIEVRTFESAKPLCFRKVDPIRGQEFANLFLGVFLCDFIV